MYSELLVEPVYHYYKLVNQLFIYSRNQLTNYQIELVQLLVSRFVVEPLGALEATHIINNKLIHATGLFFAWHQWFVQLYETAIREECGYSGYQPYWD